MTPITLITDFGTKDHYVGSIKGTILRTAPAARIVDITHEIGAHDVVHGAYVLFEAVKTFPPGTVHVAVVDPGVGSKRRILAGRYAGQVVIAPDNGLITLVHRHLPLEEMVSVENTHYFPGPVSQTFQGRDILAPVAAHVASGVPLVQLGPPTASVDILRLPEPVRLEPVGLRGQVLFVDHFGTLITNINVDDLASLFRSRVPMEVYVEDQVVGSVLTTFSDVDINETVAMVGSLRMLEVAVNRGRACDRFAAAAGTEVTLRPADDRT